MPFLAVRRSVAVGNTVEKLTFPNFEDYPVGDISFTLDRDQNYSSSGLYMPIYPPTQPSMKCKPESDYNMVFEFNDTQETKKRQLPNQTP